VWRVGRWKYIGSIGSQGFESIGWLYGGVHKKKSTSCDRYGSGGLLSLYSWCLFTYLFRCFLIWLFSYLVVDALTSSFSTDTNSVRHRGHRCSYMYSIHRRQNSRCLQGRIDTRTTFSIHIQQYVSDVGGLSMTTFLIRRTL